MAIENVIITGSKWIESDVKTLFGDEQVFFADSDEMGALMRELGVYKSANEARRCGRAGPVPEGWTAEFKASKKRRLWIWNPTE